MGKARLRNVLRVSPPHSAERGVVAVEERERERERERKRGREREREGEKERAHTWLFPVEGW